MSLTFKQIVDQTLANSFGETQRQSAQEWVRARHTWIWDLEKWTFREASANVTVTAGSSTVTNMPADFGAALGLYNAQGDPLEAYRDPRAFMDVYNVNTGAGGNGKPAAYTVRGTTLIVGPKSSETSALYLLEYERKKPTLSADGDLTGLPDGYDLALVHGAKAEGFKVSTIPGMSAEADADFQAYIEALRSNYLTAVRNGNEQMPAYRPC